MSRQELVIDEEALTCYLAETLAPEHMATVEKALRSSSELRERLEAVRSNRGESGLHTLGAIWRRARVTCATRQQLGSFLLEALDPAVSDYIKFHIEVVECPYCVANLADLKAKSEHAPAVEHERRKRYFQSSKHLLKDEK